MANELGEVVGVEPITWTAETEVDLFHAMKGHKPVGVDKHIQMILIQEKLSNSLNRSVSAKQIWEHLCTLYDLQALNESEVLPFPLKETEFSLPKSQFGEQMKGLIQRAGTHPGSSETEKDKSHDRTASSDFGRERDATVETTPSSKISSRLKDSRSSSRSASPAAHTDTVKRKRGRPPNSPHQAGKRRRTERL